MTPAIIAVVIIFRNIIYLLFGYWRLTTSASWYNNQDTIMPGLSKIDPGFPDIAIIISVSHLSPARFGVTESD